MNWLSNHVPHFLDRIFCTAFWVYKKICVQMNAHPRDTLVWTAPFFCTKLSLDKGLPCHLGHIFNHLELVLLLFLSWYIGQLILRFKFNMNGALQPFPRAAPIFRYPAPNMNMLVEKWRCLSWGRWARIFPSKTSELWCQPGKGDGGCPHQDYQSSWMRIKNVLTVSIFYEPLPTMVCANWKSKPPPIL